MPAERRFALPAAAAVYLTALFPAPAVLDASSLSAALLTPSDVVRALRDRGARGHAEVVEALTACGRPPRQS